MNEIEEVEYNSMEESENPVYSIHGKIFDSANQIKYRFY